MREKKLDDVESAAPAAVAEVAEVAAPETAAPEVVVAPAAVPAMAAAPPTPTASQPAPVRQSVREPTPAAPALTDDAERQIRRMSRRSFLWGGVVLGTGYGGWRWLISRRDEAGVPWPFRRALETNEQLARDYFKTTRLSPEFAKSQIGELRVNGDDGLPEDFDPATWMLQVFGLAQGEEPLTLGLDAVKKLPHVEMVTELRCIEGWSTIMHWGGARLADFMAKYPPATRSGDPPDVQNKPADLPGYVSLETPDGGYYVGLDMESALHPQTLLCYEMNGAPLTVEHGGPLRLVIPVKYGIKNIKRIGAIHFTDRRPADYWAERGYDWYAGH